DPKPLLLPGRAESVRPIDREAERPVGTGGLVERVADGTDEGERHRAFLRGGAGGARRAQYTHRCRQRQTAQESTSQHDGTHTTSEPGFSYRPTRYGGRLFRFFSER